MYRLMLSVLCAVWAGAVLGQSVMPDQRYIITQDVDFFGADRTALFDTTFQACRRACSADDQCVAFTFNTRSNACFPKSGISDQQPYAGAMSAQRINRDAAAQRAADGRAAALEATPEDITAARTLAQEIGMQFPVNGAALNDMIDAARAALDRGARAEALRWTGRAVALSDAADLWMRYGDLSLRLGDAVPARARTQARRDAIPAALNAYVRADTLGGQASALQSLAQAFEANGRGRDTVRALRLAQNLQPRDDIAVALDAAIAKYGFRVVDTRVDNNSARPRICASFSDPLVPTGVDYDPFVRTDATGLVVTVEGSDLCVDGVRHGTRYALTLRAGLPAQSGEALAKDTALTLYVRDRAPSVRFPGRNYVLPRGAGASVPIETVNLNEVDLVLSRVDDRNLVQSLRRDFFARPLAGWQADQFRDGIAQEIWRGTGVVQNTLNTDMRTRLPLDQALSGQAPGIYVLNARETGNDDAGVMSASQWFVLSDLGISSWQGSDGLTVAVRRLGDAAAVADARVRLISRANAVLGEVRSGVDGFARFDPGLSRGRGAAAPAVLHVETADDFVFLPLTDPAFDLSDRGVEGRAPAPAVDVFLTTDRGAYRPGATIHLTALARDAGVRAIADLPLTTVLRRPDGVEYSRTTSTAAVAGGHVIALPLESDVPRGTWRIAVLADPDAPPLASATVLVEDFVPDRIDVDLAMSDTPIPQGGGAQAQIDVRYLFGAPGADLAIEGDVRVQRRTGIAQWPGFAFGRHDAAFATQRAYFDGGRTDAQGRATVAVALPDISAEGVVLEAVTHVRVFDSAGRPVERSVTRPIAPDGPLIGIRAGFEDVLPEGGTARFDLIAVGADAPLPVQWTLNKVETRYQWYQLYGNWNWEPVTRRIRVARGDMTLGAVPRPLEVGTDWGAYELVVEGQGASYTASSVGFAAGWYGGGDATSTPDRLALSLDATDYDVGDVADLRIVPPFDGVALITVLTDGVVARRSVPVIAGENRIALDVTDDWGTGAYVTASVLRGAVDADIGPTRVLGLAHAGVNPGPKALDVRIDAPPEVDGQPGSTQVSVHVDGLNGAAGFVTLAAVDVGILNLTGFDAPDPRGHYFGQRRLGVDMRDMYGRLIDTGGAMGSVRSGGDASGAMQRSGPPPTEAVMAAFSSPVPVDADGVARITVPRPNFNGTIRLMAVAWSDAGVGQATAEVIARDPVVISAALPRFLAPGDTSRVMLEFVHARGPAGPMTFTVSGTGVEVGAGPGTVDLAAGDTLRVTIPLAARGTGDHRIDVALRTPDGTALRKTLALGVRANDPAVAVTRRLALGVGATLTFDDNVFANLRADTARATLAAGPLARFDMPGLLRQLDRYPYGCTEQVTSAALPLLFVPQTAGAAGLTDVQARIDSAIARVLTRQASNGAFGMWRARSGEFWLDAYVTDFLTRARALGHAVPDTALRLALDNLRNRVTYAPDFDTGGADIAYALMVLAREGAASVGDLRYYADTKAQAFATPLARAQLGAALASYGEQTRADRLFALADDLATRQDRDANGWRDDYGTALRDAAGLLHLSAEAGSTRVDRARLSARITARTDRYSTQEAAHVLMAAAALRDDTASAPLQVDGVAVSGPVVQTRVAGAPVSVIRNVSDQVQDVTLTTYGVPTTPPEAGGFGYAITRIAYDLDGRAVSGPWRVGERRVIVLRVQPFEDVGARLIVDDPLPAGIEIDNPNLLRAGDLRGLDWLQPAPVEHAEFRTDRFLAAIDHRGADPFEVAYIVRAVSPGAFHHPAALVEDMYRAEYRAVTATGRTVVAE